MVKADVAAPQEYHGELPLVDLSADIYCKVIQPEPWSRGTSVVGEEPRRIKAMGFCKRDEDSRWRCEAWFHNGSIACDFCGRNPACEGSEHTEGDLDPLIEVVLATEPAKTEIPDDDSVPF
jgi:hypothetical protein